MSIFKRSERTVKSAMSSQVISVKHDSTVTTAAEKMQRFNIGLLPIEDDGGTLVGVITDRDLALKALSSKQKPHEIKVGSIMTKNPVCCMEYTSLEDAVKLMQNNFVRRLVVVDEVMKPVGVVSADDLAMQQSKFVAPTLRRIAEHIREKQAAI